VDNEVLDNWATRLESAAATTQPADRVLVDELIACAKEAVTLMDDAAAGHYKPDSFTSQPLRIALAALESAEAKGEGVGVCWRSPKGEVWTDAEVRYNGKDTTGWERICSSEAINL
jgi:hypothetical protein